MAKKSLSDSADGGVRGPAPWEILGIVYLIGTGAAWTLANLLDGEYAWRYLFGRVVSFLAWADSAEVIPTSSVLWQVIAGPACLTVGLIAVCRPAKRRSAFNWGWVVLAITAVLEAAEHVHGALLWFVPRSGFYTARTCLKVAGVLAFPVFLLWFLRACRRGIRSPIRVMLRGTLLILGTIGMVEVFFQLTRMAASSGSIGQALLEGAVIYTSWLGSDDLRRALCLPLAVGVIRSRRVERWAPPLILMGLLADAIFWGIGAARLYASNGFEFGCLQLTVSLFRRSVAPALVAAALIPLLRRERRSALEYPTCLACGYNLTGNVSGVCPECGARHGAPVTATDGRSWRGPSGGADLRQVDSQAADE